MLASQSTARCSTLRCGVYCSVYTGQRVIGGKLEGRTSRWPVSGVLARGVKPGPFLPRLLAGQNTRSFPLRLISITQMVHALTSQASPPDTGHLQPSKTWQRGLSEKLTVHPWNFWRHPCSVGRGLSSTAGAVCEKQLFLCGQRTALTYDYRWHCRRVSSRRRDKNLFWILDSDSKVVSLNNDHISVKTK